MVLIDECSRSNNLVHLLADCNKLVIYKKARQHRVAKFRGGLLTNLMGMA